ncbi:MAG: glycoside hydrolase family 1 protein [Candidatus Magasanikbacteria bacterium CG_4_9_14_3_um_filter_32_9]|uniref:Glycoside hydrolase family 1 protein n=1 Tax=Candidatus Magasanikbacteria bacterium CG_4_9_14_3_um_filter_32_9 TaxID=1974644 RepID=A0A2M7Z6J2_9BACT|nr:MAG: glycoside hydrolase family 1 protein [Candidatus Magasanikbacteria bacterium CG_4_9_14_3_um_filter_32_9]
MSNTKPPKEEELVFPKDFLWGSSTAAHQVEGNNKNNDWWEFEQTRPPKFRSKDACNQYNKYKEDFKLLKDLGQNAHRLSLEWSRLEPTEGNWDEKEWEHYRKVLEELKKQKIKICLTIHHFTNPKWLMAKGWEKRSVIKKFTRFAEEASKRFGDIVDVWITINEPMVFLYQGWKVGTWPPNKKVSFWKTSRVFFNLVKAHKKAYKKIKKHSKSPIGIANNCQSFYPYDRRRLSSFIWVYFIELFTNHLFYFFSKIKNHDFLGLNYYFYHRVVKKGVFKTEFLDPEIEKRDRSDLGWEINPDGLFDVLLSLNHYKKPIFITECGLASTHDGRRQRFLVQFARQVHHAIQSGVKVKGFFYWSFLDNFEWADGFEPRFGMVEVDYKTQKRTPRPSAYLYKKIAEQNKIDHDLFKFFGHNIDFDPKTNKTIDE